jgi:hypothetical protein
MSKQGIPSTEWSKKLESMYVRAEHWVSDDDFYADEFRFLINLADKYFIGLLMTDSEASTKIKDSVERLLKLDDTRMSIARQNKEHKAYLAGLIQNKVLFDPEECVDRQADLEADQTYFLSKYRSVKKELFHLAERLLESARLKN